MCLLILIAIRAFRTSMNTANRIPPLLALLPKCRIQANRLCGSTIARSPSPMKKRRSSRNMPRSNPPNRRPPIKGNVGSNDFRLLLWTSLRDLTMLICISAITLAFLLVVLFSQLPSCPSRPRHAQPHPPHNPQFKCLYFLLYVSCPVGQYYIPPCFPFCIAGCYLFSVHTYYRCLVHRAILILLPPFPFVSDLAWLLRVWTW